MINKLVINKYIKNLKKMKMTINTTNILEGHLCAFPKFNWYFVQSTDEPNIFELHLLVESSGLKKFTLKKYTHFCVKDKNVYFIKDNKVVLGMYYVMIGDSYQDNLYSFFNNVLPSEIYEYDDLINIINAVAKEINEYLYNSEANKENINYNNSGVESLKTFTEDEVKQLIKKGHRSYMDNKNSIKGE